MPFIIFSVDNEANPINRAAFVSYIANCDKRGACVPVIGCYKGVREFSWIIHKDDFDKYVKNSGFVDNQESFLQVASGNKMETVLLFPASGERVPLGCMHQVDESEALASDAWTYRPDMGVYWIAKSGNPDFDCEA